MYEYVGNGQYIPGVPMRDLTDEEWKAILSQWRVLAERLYRKVERKAVKHGGD